MVGLADHMLSDLYAVEKNNCYIAHTVTGIPLKGGLNRVRGRNQGVGNLMVIS